MSTSTLTRTADPARSDAPTRIAVPRTATSVVVASMVVASLAPSLLPRSSLTQAIVTGLLAAVGLAMSAAVHRLVRSRWTPRARPTVCRMAVVSATLAVIGAAWVDARWQNDLRLAMNTEPTSAMHWVEVLCGSVSVSAISVVLAVGLARLLRRLGTTGTLAVATISVAIGYLVVVPATVSSMSASFAASNAAVDASLTIPVSSRVSGSSDSLISWTGLGREGRKFASAAAHDGAVRTYVGVDAAPSVEQRAAIAADELARAGGFTKSHIVVSVPTGSGWVDENAVDGFEERFGGDVATVALQYSYQPSWATFLFAESLAGDSATALLDAVGERIESLPSDSRPDLYVYGQSLGAVGAGAATTRDSHRVCGTLLAGPPAGKVPTGADVVLANSSDPVIRWSSNLILTPPDLRVARVDAPMPQWIPLVSYLQTTIDMVTALDAPDGHGHRYGTDQGTLLPGC